MKSAFIFRLILAVLLLAALPAIAKSRTVKKSLEKELQPQAQPIANDDDDDLEKFERPGMEDENDGGDPYPRYSESTLHDGNCDPTLLRQIYNKYERLTCNLSLNTGACINFNDDAARFGLLAFGTSAGTYKLSKDRMIYKLRDLRTRSEIAQLKGEKLAPNEAKELAELNAKFIGQSEKLKMMTRIRLAAKGARFGLGAVVGVGAFYLYTYSDLFMQKIQVVNDKVMGKLVCTAPEEQDPYFKDYVPVQSGTCRTPLYLIGHPKVQAFLAAPMKEKMKALKNKLTCGFYKSLNIELEKRIAMEEGRPHIEKVRCDQASGQIDFQIKKINKAVDEQYFSIRRRPGTEEFADYRYLKTINGKIQEQANFDLAKQEEDIQLIKTTFYMSDSDPEHVVMTSKIPDFQDAEPIKSRNVFSAFRLARRYSRNLAMCCDLDPPRAPTAEEKLDLKKRGNVKKRLKQIALYEKLCPKDWFESPPREPVTASGSAVKGAR
jgi:hypothetical protein